MNEQGDSSGGEKLQVTAGQAAGSTIELTEELLIGRAFPGDGTLGNDPEISRRHARISRGPSGEFVLEDTGSTNGTFVNGQQLTAPHTLQPGDVIALGQTTMTFVAPTPPAAETVSGEEAPPAEDPATADTPPSGTAQPPLATSETPPQYVPPSGAAQTPPQQAPQAAPAQPEPATPLPPANWYPDPLGQARLRYWDGRQWTEHIAQ
jgi:pSer/pThr/pTyr-binding forkhead associated (FHA) protein